MNKFALFVSAAVALASVAAPAQAEDGDRWTYLAQETLWSEEALSNVGVTRAQDEPGIDSFFMACRPGRSVGLCLSAWNSTSIDSDPGIRSATGETDLEAELSFRNFIGGATVRVKGAVYLIDGEDIYSLRVALDHALGDSCSGTVFIETLTGQFEFQVYKASATCSIPVGDWNLSGDIGVAYNTLNEQTVAPLELRFIRGERIFGGIVAGAYFSDDSDFRIGARAGYRF